METALSPEKQGLVSSFLEIAVGQTQETAVKFLEMTNWKLEDAIQLFYVGNDGGKAAAPSSSVDSLEKGVGVASDDSDDGVEEEYTAPLPIKTEVLYGQVAYVEEFEAGKMFRFENFKEDQRRQAVWDVDPNASSASNGSGDNLASLYRPPFGLLFNGPFDKAKEQASSQDKWLLVNLQSAKEFSSHMLNRDTWSNETVAETIRTNFVFWQVYDDTYEGRKVSTYYKLDSAPAVLVIDSITGEKMRAWTGMIHPERLLEDLLPFMEKGPNEHHASLPPKRARQTPKVSKPAKPAYFEGEEDHFRRTASDAKSTAEKGPETSSSVRTPTYPLLPEEPKGNKELLSRVGIRLPNGLRLQRNFLRSDPIKLLWSYCASQLEEAKGRPFRFTQPIPCSSKTLNFDSDLTFEESGISNCMISLTWI